MATSIDNGIEAHELTKGLLVVIAEVISDEQQHELISLLNQALKRLDKKKFAEIEHIFTHLIVNDQFQPDSQYRQIASADNGSLAGFLYLPNFHAVLNVLKDFFNHCSSVSIVFVGQQIDSNGAWILSDSIFTADHLHNLFEGNSSFITEDLQILFPFVSHQWTRLVTHYFQKRLKHVQFDSLIANLNGEDLFGQKFYDRFVECINRESFSSDIYRKLIPRDSAGTIAFDEPNLYILYGQQGEASLFGIRGFVVLVNGGFSRMPSYWNLIRGLQTIDACILTHFDYDVLPGLQTVIHRKTIPISDDGRSCKPDIGALFINQVQRTRLQTSPSSKRSSNSKLAVNLSDNVDQFLTDVRKLNIETFDLIKHQTPNKPSIEPINLYKKIAFGSLDLFVLHPTTLPADDDKILSTVQKIPIRDQQPSPSIIPLHHWYSSCSLLVWTPTSKSSKDNLVRILYTGACPQTLVFEALTRVRHLELLHESYQQQHQASRLTPVKTNAGTNSTKTIPQKPKGPSPETTKGTTIPKPRSAPSTTAAGKKTSVSTTKKVARVVISKSVDSPHTLKQNNGNGSVHVRVNDDGNSEGTTNSDDPVSHHDDDSLENDLKRPTSISFTDDNPEAFVKSNTATPIDEVASHPPPMDPMTTSFVDGAPNTRNPFLEQSSENDDEGEMNIIHHTINTTNKQPMPSIDEITPLGLPMDDDNHSKKPGIKKPTQRLSVPTIPTRKTKTTTPAGPIFYVDVAYIPYHGNEHYVDSEFFRRIRARYYVLNAVEISRLTLESLLDGKQQWDKQEQTPVTLVPTFDGDQLRQFFVMNKTRLAELNVNILPASTRCNVQYDDEGSPAQRLRFTAN